MSKYSKGVLVNSGGIRFDNVDKGVNGTTYYKVLPYTKVTEVTNESGDLISCQIAQIENKSTKVIYEKDSVIVVLNNKYSGFSYINESIIGDAHKAYEIAYAKAVLAQVKDDLKELTGKEY